ncbi:chromosomal replication initiator DnaA [Phaeovulum sp.]|uniref:chromosomal replication initiator DnaA n=1 Tax=Phaeovulum sp. TaxID=2934796 RepID=UPI0039E543C2
MEYQLTFDLPLRAAQGREDFFIAPSNALALATLDAPETWPLGKLVLIGPEGAGKSHLAQIWADTHGASLVRAAELRADTAPQLASARAVVVEDAHQIGGLPQAEAALFHLHNLLGADAGLLLVTAQTPPRDWALSLPDLSSRMQAAATVRLDPPDDALLAAVLVKLFADRQIAVTPTLIPWLVTRIDRSFATARQIVAALDAKALQKGAPVTRVLAAEVLDTLP